MRPNTGSNSRRVSQYRKRQTGGRIESVTGDVVTVYSFPTLGGANGNFATVTIDVSPALVQRFGPVSGRSSYQYGQPGGEIRGRFSRGRIAVISTATRQ